MAHALCSCPASALLRADLCAEVGMPSPSYPKLFLFELFREGLPIATRSKHIRFVGQALLPAVRFIELGQQAAESHPDEEIVALVGQDVIRRLEVENATGFVEPPDDPEY